jgi:hypothetical protein
MRESQDRLTASSSRSAPPPSRSAETNRALTEVGDVIAAAEAAYFAPQPALPALPAEGLF